MTEITVLLIGMFILLIVSYALSEYDFFSPSFIVCLVFTFGAALALYATKSWGIPESIFSAKATWIMLSGTAVFILFEHLTRRIVLPKDRLKKRASQYVESKPIHVNSLKMMVLIIICILGTALYVLAVYNKVRANGYSGGFNFAAIAVYNHRLSFLDDVEGGAGRITSYLNTAARMAMYICMYIFFNNVVSCREKIKANLKYFIPVVTWIPNILVTSSRGSYLQVAGAMVLFFYVSLCRRNHWVKMRKNHHKLIKYAAISFAVILFAFYAVSATGLIGRTTEKNFIDTITIYLGAPIIHFHQFITNPPANVSYFGQETFTKLLPVLQRFGMNVERVSGQMEVRTITGIYRGNVYTFFRRPYHDFGLFGMYLIIALTAILFSYFYYKKIYGKYQSYKNDRVLILYSYFFYIIYIFAIDCAIYLYVYFGLVFFFAISYLLYAFVFSNRITLRGRSRAHSFKGK